MAFSGTPVIKLVADNLIRLRADTGRDTHFGLVSGASGTIGLFEKTVAPDVRLLEAFKPREYKNAEGVDVSLQASIQVEISYADTGALVCPIRVVKTGTTPEDFAITLTNDDPGEFDSGDLDIYIRFH